MVDMIEVLRNLGVLGGDSVGLLGEAVRKPIGLSMICTSVWLLTGVSLATSA